VLERDGKLHRVSVTLCRCADVEMGIKYVLSLSMYLYHRSCLTNRPTH
jgi:hypothetical protein